MQRMKLMAGVLLLVGAGLASAHHSVFAEYDIYGSVTVEGVVTEVWFKSPHIRVFIDVEGESGEVVSWNTHGHNPTALRRRGWARDSISVGDKIVATGDPTFDGSPKMFLRTITMEDGTVFENKAGRP